MTGVTLEKRSNPDNYMFFQQRMRDAVSYINKRYSKASKNVSVFYLDMNNLYGCAMRKYLPINKLSGLKILIKSNKK